jgi:hypothetical protein
MEVVFARIGIESFIYAPAKMGQGNRKTVLNFEEGAGR